MSAPADRRCRPGPVAFRARLGRHQHGRSLPRGDGCPLSRPDRHCRCGPAAWSWPTTTLRSSAGYLVEHQADIVTFVDGRAGPMSRGSKRRSAPVSPSKARRQPATTDPSTARDAAHVLRPHHRVGLARRAGAHPDLRDRPAQSPTSRCPKFLDDGDATRLARPIAVEPDRLRRLTLDCCCRPVCASGSCARSRPTPSCRSVTAGGCGSRSANSTTTVTCRCYRQPRRAARRLATRPRRRWHRPVVDQPRPAPQPSRRGAHR